MDSRSQCGLTQDTPSKKARSIEPMNLGEWPATSWTSPERAWQRANGPRTRQVSGMDAVRAELGEAGRAFSADTEIFRPLRPEFAGCFCGERRMP